MRSQSVARDEPNAITNAIGYATFRIRSHEAVIRIYDQAGNVIETHQHAGEFAIPAVEGIQFPPACSPNALFGCFSPKYVLLPSLPALSIPAAILSSTSTQRPPI
jgi:hypothetical protein